MGEEPLETRWAFEDFKMLYDARFGRKEFQKEVPSDIGRHDDGYANLNGNFKGASDMAVYEQFEQQERRPGIEVAAVCARSHGAILKPLLPTFDSAEARSLAETLCRDIIRGSPDVKWETIKGLENAKRLVKEAVVMPIKYPKPCLPKLSQLSAKLHFLIFQHLQLLANGEMDGLTKTDELVFVLAATNLPWELDAAMLRRLEKRILVPLPEPEARQAIFNELLSSTFGKESAIPYDYLVEKTEGYSGSDIRLVCKEAAMQPLRRLMAFLESRQEEVPEHELPSIGPVTPEDIMQALINTRPSAHLHAHRYDKFNQDYGSQILY